MMNAFIVLRKLNTLASGKAHWVGLSLLVALISNSEKGTPCEEALNLI